MVAVPAAMPAASPRPPPPGPPPPGPPPPVVMLATAPFEVVHEAAPVTVWVVPSSSVTMATNGCVPLTTIEAACGVTSRPVGWGARTVSAAESVNPL